MTTLNPDRLTNRVYGRQEAEACIALMLETRAGLGAAAMLVFWETLREFLNGHAPEPELKSGKPVPMTASEVMAFETEICPLKKYKGDPVEQVPLGYLDYMVGLRTDPDDFVNRAARYLANEQVAERLREELAREDWRQDE